jgi:hypothetical protein
VDAKRLFHLEQYQANARLDEEVGVVAKIRFPFIILPRWRDENPLLPGTFGFAAAGLIVQKIARTCLRSGGINVVESATA